MSAVEWVVDDLVSKEAELSRVSGLAGYIHAEFDIRVGDVFSGRDKRGVVMVERLVGGAALMRPLTQTDKPVRDLMSDHYGPVPVYGEPYRDKYGFWATDVVGYESAPCYGFRPGEPLIYVGPAYAENATLNEADSE